MWLQGGTGTSVGMCPAVALGTLCSFWERLQVLHKCSTAGAEDQSLLCRENLFPCVDLAVRLNS